MLIQNACLYDMAGLWGEKRDIRVENGVIAAVAETLPALPGEECFDAAGRIVMPGLIDAHSEVGLASQVFRFERNDADEDTDPVQLTLRAVDAVNFADEGFEMLRTGGVTTAVTGPGSKEVIGGSFTAVKTGGSRIADRILKEECAFAVSLTGAPRSAFGGKNKAPVTRMASAALVRENLRKARFYKEKTESGKGEFQLGLESFSRVLDGMPVKFTALATSDIRDAVRIAEEFGLNYTVDSAYDGVKMFPELLAHGSRVVLGTLYGGGQNLDNLERKLENGPLWEKSGVDFCLNVGHPGLNGSLVLPYLALLHKFGMSREAILEGVTIKAARLCGIDGRVGSLEAGKDADLLVLSGDPLDYYTDIDMMMIGGEIL